MVVFAVWDLVSANSRRGSEGCELPAKHPRPSATDEVILPWSGSGAAAFAAAIRASTLGKSVAMIERHGRRERV
jgi:hypothetical protein